MFQYKVKGVSDPLGEGLILEDVLAPGRKLLHIPNAFSCKLEISSADRPILVVVVDLFFCCMRGVRLDQALEMLNFFDLSEALLQAIGHVVDQTVQEFFKIRSADLLSDLLSEALVRPKSLKDLGTVMPILELCEEHPLASELDVHIELDYCLHQVPVYYLGLIHVVR